MKFSITKLYIITDLMDQYCVTFQDPLAKNPKLLPLLVVFCLMENTGNKYFLVGRKDNLFVVN